MTYDVPDYIFQTYVAAVVRRLALSGPDVVVAHESVGGANFDQA